MTVSKERACIFPNLSYFSISVGDVIISKARKKINICCPFETIGAGLRAAHRPRLALDKSLSAQRQPRAYSYLLADLCLVDP